jgi:hypothetical protein
MALVHLVYVSRREPWLTGQELERIAAAGIRANESRQITSILIAGTQTLVQVLEGEASAVETLFDRIRRDPRHTNVRRILFTEIAERLFSASSMRVVSAGTREARKVLKQLTVANAADLGELKPTRGQLDRAA